MVVLKINLAGGAVDTRKQQTPVVKVEQPRRESIVQTVRFTGDVLPIQQAQVFARVYGTLDNVYANIGDFVHKGQLLALVDTLVLAQQCREAQASYVNDSLQFVRAKGLLDRSLIAQQDYDNAQTALKVAQSNYESALTNLLYAKISAPFSGFITKRYLDPGAVLISTNATVFTLMDLDVMKVMVNVQEKDIPSVSVGTEVVIAVDAYPNEQFSGKVVRLSQALDLGTRTMAVEADIPNGDHILKPGMFASVSMIIGKKDDAVTVPSQALQKDQGGTFVFVADSSVARRVAVTVGVEQDSHTEILSGLQGNEKVITTGQQFTRDGGPIRVQP